MEFWVISIGIAWPGLDGWAAARPILAGETEYRPAPLRLLFPKLLSAAERRRCSQSARLAIAAAGTPCWLDLSRRRSPPSLPLRMVTGLSRRKSADHWPVPHVRYPPSFHNSVYKPRPAYWSIATRSQLSSTSVCAYDVSFAAGLLEAATYTTVERCRVMLVASDLPFPRPLYEIRPVEKVLPRRSCCSDKPSPMRACGARSRWPASDHHRPFRYHTRVAAQQPGGTCWPCWARQAADTVRLGTRTRATS